MAFYQRFWGQNMIYLLESFWVVAQNHPWQRTSFVGVWKNMCLLLVLNVSLLYLQKSMGYCMFSSWSPGMSCKYPVPRPNVWVPLYQIPKLVYLVSCVHILYCENCEAVGMCLKIGYLTGSRSFVSLHVVFLYVARICLYITMLQLFLKSKSLAL